MSKLHIKKGDTVYVNTDEDKGKTGHVLKVLVRRECIIIEGINMASKSIESNAENPQGGIAKQGTPTYISNLNPVDPKADKTTCVSGKISSEGTLARYSKESGEETK